MTGVLSGCSGGLDIIILENEIESMVHLWMMERLGILLMLGLAVGVWCEVVCE